MCPGHAISVARQLHACMPFSAAKPAIESVEWNDEIEHWNAGIIAGIKFDPKAITV